MALVKLGQCRHTGQKNPYRQWQFRRCFPPVLTVHWLCHGNAGGALQLPDLKFGDFHNISPHGDRNNHAEARSENRDASTQKPLGFFVTPPKIRSVEVRRFSCGSTCPNVQYLSQYARCHPSATRTVRPQPAARRDLSLPK